jgi:hypothetical protein
MGSISQSVSTSKQLATTDCCIASKNSNSNNNNNNNNEVIGNIIQFWGVDDGPSRLMAACRRFASSLGEKNFAFHNSFVDATIKLPVKTIS